MDFGKFPKLLPRFVGPFAIADVLPGDAYRLILPDTWQIHDVFHVSLLKPCPTPVFERGEGEQQDVPTVDAAANVDLQQQQQQHAAGTSVDDASAAGATTNMADSVQVQVGSEPSLQATDNLLPATNVSASDVDNIPESVDNAAALTGSDATLPVDFEVFPTQQPPAYDRIFYRRRSQHGWEYLVARTNQSYEEGTFVLEHELPNSLVQTWLQQQGLIDHDLQEHHADSSEYEVDALDTYSSDDDAAYLECMAYW